MERDVEIEVDPSPRFLWQNDLSKVDQYPHYLTTRLQFKTNARMDLGQLDAQNDIVLMTFLNLCLSENVLSEADFDRAMSRARASEEDRKNPGEVTVVKI